MWSLANEVLYWKKNAKSFISSLQNTAKKLNSERETMVARLTLPRALDALLGDKSTGVADVIGVNIYKGWYYGSLDGIEKSLAKIHKKFPNKPMIVSEFGAGAVQGNHLEADANLNEKNKKHTYSEEFQVHLYKSYFKAIDKLDFIQGTMPWVFADFRMQWNPNTGNPHPVQLTNLKGVVSGTREKKLVFDWLKNNYEFKLN